jgi:hypothetical protein
MLESPGCIHFLRLSCTDIDVGSEWFAMFVRSDSANFEAGNSLG